MIRTSTDSGYIITDEPQRLDFAAVHAWLSGSYWSPGITRAQVEQAARHSALVAGAYQPYGGQVGYCRVVSDRTRVAWLADVFVDPDHRGKGVGRAMVAFAMSHPELAEVETWHLATRDAHGVYAVLGFGPLPHPERMMQLRKVSSTP